MVVVVDYGMGNLRSVEKGFQHVGVDARVSSNPRDVDDASAIVLPGVGAFRDCMANLSRMGLMDAITKAIRKGKPYLGICLGLQVLFTESEEFGKSRGMDIFSGTVPRFGAGDLKVPHMGWNGINVKKRPPLLEGIYDGAYFYFVHSYYVKPEDDGIVAATTEYGIEFASMVWKENLFATQFHPEKSQKLGLAILRNFGDFARKA